MNKTIYRIASLIMVLAIFLGNNIQAQAAGSVYYVSPTGNDANPGTASAPFKTFARANSVLTAGSTLNIYAGIYTEQLKISKSGTSNDWITVKSLSGTVVIDMKNLTNPAVNISGSYVALNNLEMRGSNDICVRLAGKYLRASGLIVHECRTHGIFTVGQHVEITGNTVYRTSLSNQLRNLSSGWGSGIKVGLAGDDILIKDNKVYNNYGEGIAATRGSNVTMRDNNVYDNFSVNIYVDNSFNILLERNFVTCHPNSGFERDGSPAVGIGMGEEFYTDWGAKLDHVTVRNNIVAFCKNGIRYNGASDSLTGGGLKNVTIAYNTLYGSTGSVLSVVYESAQAGSLIANNIVWQSQNILTYINNPAGITFKNNQWKVLPATTVRSSGDRIGDPKFASTPGYTPESYRLEGFSPAAAGAADIGIPEDFFAKQRGPTFDMGAIQFATTSTNSIVQATATLAPTKIVATSTLLSATPQATSTSVLPTTTTANTLLPSSPTATTTSIAPTIQPTNTPVSSLPTVTASPLPSTLTASPTPLQPTVTPTKTIPPADTPSATTMPTNTASVSSVTLTPLADSYANSSYPTTNYGTATTFRVDGSPIVLSYLRFDIKGLSGNVSRATLRIFANSAASAGVVANSLSDNSWTESTINDNNAPPVGNALGSSGAFGAGVWVSIDITAYVTGNGTYSLALTTPGSTAISLASRESGANAPQLIIQTSP